MTALTLNLSTPTTTPATNPKGAGRKPASTINPIAHIVSELTFIKPQWFDDIVFGSCLTSAGQSQNVCNVSMNEVVGALHLKEFKVDVLTAQGTDKRKAQRIIKAARHVAHGVYSYLARRPDLLKSYEDAAKLETSLAPSPISIVRYTPLQDVPQWITDLRIAGDYLAYGEALRAFRRKSNG
ncbi:hypothetical protein [Pseudomonas farris]